MGVFLATLEQPIQAATAGGASPGSADFERLCRLVHERFGIELSPSKRRYVRDRLQRELGRQGQSFKGFLREVERDRSGPAMVRLTEAVTTHHTSFFREAAHFDVLRERVLVPYFSKARAAPLRIWSAACSTGEEAWSIGIEALECAAAQQRPPTIELLGTDLAPDVVEKAKRAMYPEKTLAKMERERVRRWFQRGVGACEGLVRPKPAVRSLGRFEVFNLLTDTPSSRPFAAVFLRNVLIYFDRPTQEKVVARCLEHLVPGGLLFLGQSDLFPGAKFGLQLIGQSVFRKEASRP